MKKVPVKPTPSKDAKRVTSNIPSQIGPRKRNLEARTAHKISDGVDKAVRKLTPLPDKKRAVKTEPTRYAMTATENRVTKPTSKKK